jgi:hypothetical protein
MFVNKKIQKFFLLVQFFVFWAIFKWALYLEHPGAVIRPELSSPLGIIVSFLPLLESGVKFFGRQGWKPAVSHQQAAARKEWRGVNSPPAILMCRVFRRDALHFPARQLWPC